MWCWSEIQCLGRKDAHHQSQHDHQCQVAYQCQEVNPYHEFRGRRGCQVVQGCQESCLRKEASQLYLLKAQLLKIQLLKIWLLKNFLSYFCRIKCKKSINKKENVTFSGPGPMMAGTFLWRNLTQAATKISWCSRILSVIHFSKFKYSRLNTCKYFSFKNMIWGSNYGYQHLYTC